MTDLFWLTVSGVLALVATYVPIAFGFSLTHREDCGSTLLTVLFAGTLASLLCVWRVAFLYFTVG